MKLSVWAEGAFFTEHFVVYLNRWTTSTSLWKSPPFLLQNNQAAAPTVLTWTSPPSWRESALWSSMVLVDTRPLPARMTRTQDILLTAPVPGNVALQRRPQMLPELYLLQDDFLVLGLVAELFFSPPLFLQVFLLFASAEKIIVFRMCFFFYWIWFSSG